MDTGHWGFGLLAEDGGLSRNDTPVPPFKGAIKDHADPSGQGNRRTAPSANCLNDSLSLSAATSQQQEMQYGQESDRQRPPKVLLSAGFVGR